MSSSHLHSSRTSLVRNPKKYMVAEWENTISL
jgi:hypothetical protein